MKTAYEDLVVVFRALARVDTAFYEASKALSNLPGTKTAESWALFGEYFATRKNDTVTLWEREITADHCGTEVRWHLEIELAHTAMTCKVSAEAGLQPKDHSTDWSLLSLREIGPHFITDLSSLSSEIDQILIALFGDLEGDCVAAVLAEQKEREEAGRAWDTIPSEQSEAPDSDPAPS